MPDRFQYIDFVWDHRHDTVVKVVQEFLIAGFILPLFVLEGLLLEVDVFTRVSVSPIAWLPLT